MSSKAGAAAAAAYKPVFSPSTSTASSLDSDFGSRALGLPRPHHQGGASSSPKVWAMSHMCFHAISSLSLFLPNMKFVSRVLQFAFVKRKKKA
jgi:hypothetical protein